MVDVDRIQSFLVSDTFSTAKVKYKDTRGAVVQISGKEIPHPDFLYALSLVTPIFARSMGLESLKSRLDAIGVERRMKCNGEDAYAITALLEYPERTGAAKVKSAALTVAPYSYFSLENDDGSLVHKREDHLDKLSEGEKEVLERALEEAGLYAIEGKHGETLSSGFALDIEG